MFGRETRMLLRQYLEQGRARVPWRANWASIATEIRAAGFEGSYTQLKGFVRQVRPSPPAEPVLSQLPAS